MKLQFLRKGNERGSVLALAIVLCILLGIGLTSYLFATRTQTMTVTRSQAWNSALEMAEAGAEEALAQLNPGVGVPIDKSANGWGVPVAGVYGPKTRSMSNDTYTVFYTTDFNPSIYATGQVSVAALSATLTRVLCIGTTNVPLFGVALGAKWNIDMNGNGIFTDSFDSSNPSFSTNGRYDVSKATTNGDVASLSGVVNVGSATINGDLYLGPSATNSIHNSGAITGTTYNDFNSDFPDVILPLPIASWVVMNPLASPTNIDGVSYPYYFPNTGDFTISGSGNIYVAPGAQVRLYVTASLSPASIRVGASGVSSGNLQLYMAGASLTLSGASTVDGGIASNLGYWGLPSNTSIRFGANAAFTGTVYAPEATVTIGGGGNNPYDFVGSCIASSVKMNGHFSFHYDENLARTGPIRGYIATSWAEL